MFLSIMGLGARLSGGVCAQQCVRPWAKSQNQTQKAQKYALLAEVSRNHCIPASEGWLLRGFPLCQSGTDGQTSNVGGSHSTGVGTQCKSEGSDTTVSFHFVLNRWFLNISQDMTRQRNVLQKQNFLHVLQKLKFPFKIIFYKFFENFKIFM